MAEREQSYKKHTRWLPLLHFFVLPVLLINVMLAVRHLLQMPTLSTAYGVAFASALFALGFASRTQALTVQDRVIRLEERLRMRQLLPHDMHAQINSLTHRQLVALRFASDEELPELIRDIVAGRLTTPKDIKMKVRNWRADWLRA
jgi:hypothetical protein